MEFEDTCKENDGEIVESDDLGKKFCKMEDEGVAVTEKGEKIELE